MSVIEAYIAELDGALRGPRRAKADLLAEGRDSLVDAAEAYERSGLNRQAAERQAVEEFGDVPEIAPGYQTELALAQGRRTALVVAFALVLQQAVAELVWRSAASGWSVKPGRGYELLATSVDWAGGLAVAGSVLAALACGIGVRYLQTGRTLIRATGLFALAVDAAFAVAALALVALNPQAWSLTTGSRLWALLAFSAVGAAWIAASARRCLAMA